MKQLKSVDPKVAKLVSYDYQLNKIVNQSKLKQFFHRLVNIFNRGHYEHKVATEARAAIHSYLLTNYGEKSVPTLSFYTRLANLTGNDQSLITKMTENATKINHLLANTLNNVTRTNINQLSELILQQENFANRLRSKLRRLETAVNLHFLANEEETKTAWQDLGEKSRSQLHHLHQEVSKQLSDNRSSLISYATSALLPVQAATKAEEKFLELKKQESLDHDEYQKYLNDGYVKGQSLLSTLEKVQLHGIEVEDATFQMTLTALKSVGYHAADSNNKIQHLAKIISQRVKDELEILKGFTNHNLPAQQLPGTAEFSEKVHLDTVNNSDSAGAVIKFPRVSSQKENRVRLQVLREKLDKFAEVARQLAKPELELSRSGILSATDGERDGGYYFLSLAEEIAESLNQIKEALIIDAQKLRTANEDPKKSSLLFPQNLDLDFQQLEDDLNVGAGSYLSSLIALGKKLKHVFTEHYANWSSLDQETKQKLTEAALTLLQEEQKLAPETPQRTVLLWASEAINPLLNTIKT